ncbi:hypothetical protein [Fodinibius saliphilus]|uniref:hypothetical protein n=1 Tax=Fodinibius saliphilus TaxID=1920650 RepID=UPI0011083EC7|nr:hypothetical protein [Fodinibius saliphilus]
MVFLLAMNTNGHAQTEVTFKVNLKPQLEDSIYIPGRDRVYLKGNTFPLSKTKNVYLKDVAPIDSIYEATVDFPSRSNGEVVKYNYYIYTPDNLMQEQRPRSIRLRGKEIELDAIYFNAFAW